MSNELTLSIIIIIIIIRQKGTTYHTKTKHNTIQNTEFKQWSPNFATQCMIIAMLLGSKFKNGCVLVVSLHPVFVYAEDGHRLHFYI